MIKKKVSKAWLFVVVCAILFSVLPVQAFAATGFTVSRSTEDKVKLFDTKDINFFHNGNLVINDTIANEKQIVFLLDNSGGLKDPIEDRPSPLEYALFNGNESNNLVLGGQTINIEGKLHSNAGFTIKANSFNLINGSIEANKTSTTSIANVNGGTPPPNLVKAAPIMKMPDLVNMLKDDAIGDTIGFKVKEFQAEDSEMTDTYYTKYIKNNGYYENQNKVYIGVKTPSDIGSRKYSIEFSGENPVIFEDKTIYIFDGDLHISSGVKLNGKAMIVATGSIKIGGNTIDTQSNNSAAFIYSQTGNIEVVPSNHIINGKLYAPKGDIRFNGTDITVNGSVVSHTLSSVPSTFNIKYKPFFDDVIPTIDPDPTLYTSLKEMIKQFANNLKDKDIVKIGVLKYDDSANNNNFLLYDIRKSSEYSALENHIDNLTSSTTNTNSGKSNLGDGLRRAGLILQSSGPASKYVVALAASQPNTWTTKVNINDIAAETVYDNSVDGRKKASEYAVSIGKSLSVTGIEPIFVNCVQSGHSNYQKVFDSIKAIYSAIQVSGAKTQFHDAKTFSSLHTVANEITTVTQEDNIPINLEFDLHLPKDVTPVGSPPYGFEYNTDGTITGKRTIDLKKISGSLYEIEPLNFTIRVKYANRDFLKDKKGAIKFADVFFPPSPNRDTVTFIYSIKKLLNVVEEAPPISVEYPQFKVIVKYEVDIT